MSATLASVSRARDQDWPGPVWAWPVCQAAGCLSDRPSGIWLGPLESTRALMVAAEDRLIAACFGLAHRIARHSLVATARIISAVMRGLNASIADGIAIEAEQFARMASTEDTRKAHAAPRGLPIARL